MLRSVFAKSIRDDRRSLMWWGVGVAAMAAWTLGMYKTYAKGASELTKFWERAPEALKALFGGDLDLGTAAGYLRAELFSFTLPLLFMIFAIGAGARAIAGEERTGTLDLLLSFPIPRRRIVAQKLGAMVTEATGIGAAFCAIAIVFVVAMGMEVSVARLAQAIAMAVLVAVAFGALSFAIGASTGSRGAAVGISTSLGVAGYLVFGMSRMIEGLAPWRWVSPWTYYAETDVIKHGVTLWHAGVLIAFAAVCALIAVRGFERRDVRA